MPSRFVFETPVLRHDLILSLFKECTPKILVFTDLNDGFAPNNDFSLSQFVATLKASTIHGKTPIVVTAHRGTNASADHDNYTFDNATVGVKKSRYDVVFIFGVGSNPSLSANEQEALNQFMDDGGGMFATGDHASLGAAYGTQIGRVRAMRKWNVDVPSAGGVDRLSTNLAGANGVFEFDDQSDDLAQRVYLNWRTDAGGVGAPHPLMQLPGGGFIEHIPDHPHEGECLIPSDLTTTFDLAGAPRDEWPAETGGGARVAPELVALSVSHGDDFPGKAALVPRAFNAIVAYDGHRCDVGRVVTDATWHHFIDINIDGSGSPREGLMPGGVDSPAMTALRQHWVNLADWLMPQTVRRCLRWPLIFRELVAYPLWETAKIPGPDADLAELTAFGAELATAMASRHPAWVAQSLVEDAFVDGVGGRAAAAGFLKASGRFGELSARSAGLAALASGVVGAVGALEKVERKPSLKPVKEAGTAALGRGVELSVKGMRADLDRLQKLLEPLGR